MMTLPWNASVKQLRQFAWFAPLGFAAIGWMTLRLGASMPVFWGLCAAGGVVLLLGLLRPTLVRPFWIVSLALAFPIGLVVTNVALAALYYLAMTPLALLFRGFGRDALGRTSKGYQRVDTAFDADSYWRQS